MKLESTWAVDGKPIPPRLRALIEKVFDLVAQELDIRKLPENIKLTLDSEYLETIQRAVLLAQLLGKTGTMIQGVAGGVNRFERHPFIMHLSLVPSMHDLFEALVHELKHVEQMASGRLMSVKSDELTYWNDRTYTDTEIDAIGHDDLPWEREADAAMKKLWPKVMASLTNTERAIMAFESDQFGKFTNVKRKGKTSWAK